MSPSLEIRAYCPGDEQQIVDAWNAIFPGNDGQAPRKLDSWRWAFEQNPLHRCESVLAFVGGELVGQYACIPQRAIKGGQELSLGLIVDGFVLPGHRRAGGSPGLIVHLARELYRRYCGPAASDVEQGHLLTHGYTTQLYRIAQRYLQSEMVRDLDLLFRELHEPPLGLSDSAAELSIQVLTAPPEDTDELWSKVASEFSFALVRDRIWFDWRYTQRPGYEYELIAVRDAAGTLRGLAVHRLGDYGLPGTGLICDWLVPGGDVDAELALLAALEEHSRAAGAVLLAAEFPQSDLRFLRWQRHGFLVGPPQQFLVMNSFGPSVLELRGSWFHTLGDSDLV
ncbi:MAG: hypothetical protein CSA62_04120 [Planctomycetota bacterium]|nr:MAG: hypothetical protein CSA62_04120 [Planctomycetota bacterium]